MWIECWSRHSLAEAEPPKSTVFEQPVRKKLYLNSGRGGTKVQYLRQRQINFITIYKYI